MTNYHELKNRKTEPQAYEAWVVLDGMNTFTGQLLTKEQLPPDIKFDNGIAFVNDGVNTFLISPHFPTPYIDYVVETDLVVKEEVNEK